MRISIVTVVFNNASTIEQTILSVAGQTYRDIEHIIIDGGSTDGTLDIIAKYRDKLALVVSEPDRGIYDAMNKGIKAAQGDVIGTLNADDFYADDTVLTQVAKAMSDPEVEACYADLVYVAADDTGRVLRYWRSCDYKPGLFLWGWMPAHPTFFVRRHVYAEHGLFDTRLKLQADFELTMRFMELRRIKTTYVPRTWVRMRMGGASNRSIKNVLRGNWESYTACRRHGFGVSPFFMVTKVASRLTQFFSARRVRRDAEVAR
ncbi:MAG: glycosyltransferase [Planctomycetes bacterium]|nr:glycosyltransferase [Planctomycetota bacterium]